MIKKFFKSKSPKSRSNEPKPPAHIGLILDGNRRWARRRKLSALEGHDKGLDRVEEVVRAAFDKGAEAVSLFVFSTDNWQRSDREVNHLMRLFVRFVKKETPRLLKEGVRFKVAGQVNKDLSADVREAIAHLHKASAKNKGKTVVLCFNYGGQNEIVDMVKKIVKKGLKASQIDAETIRDHLYHPEVPPLDLIIRTSGEQRISGFQLWRAAYAEMLFVDKYWPDFTKSDLEEALSVYHRRSRRFGGD